MRRHTGDQRGFTLIELVLYCGLLGILLVILSQFFISILQVRLATSSDSALAADATYIIERLTYDVRRMKSMSLPTVGQTGSVLTGVATDPGGDTSYTYRVTNQNLTITIGSATTQLNSSETKVTAFSLLRIGNSGQSSSAKDTIQVDMTLTSVATFSSGVKTRNIQTTIGLR